MSTVSSAIINFFSVFAEIINIDFKCQGTVFLSFVEILLMRPSIDRVPSSTWTTRFSRGPDQSCTDCPSMWIKIYTVPRMVTIWAFGVCSRKALIISTDLLQVGGGKSLLAMWPLVLIHHIQGSMQILPLIALRQILEEPFSKVEWTRHISGCLGDDITSFIRLEE